MKRNILAVAGLLASTTSAYAVGLDRSGQDIGVLFETGNHLQFSFGVVNPSLDGVNRDQLGGNPSPFAGTQIGNVGDNFNILGLGYKYQFTDQLSFGLIIDEPYGSDTLYPGSPAATPLGGTGATVDSFAVTALGRYKFDDNWSVHGGLRYQEVSANVTLGGVAFGPLNGFEADFDSDGAFGYVVGAAYEIPDIALRVSLTYNSSISHDLRTTETLGGNPVAPVSSTEVDTPESLNLTFQSGIAADTLLFGSIRYARYSDTVVSPAFFTGQTGNSLTDLEDGFDFELGVGRRFNEQWSGSIAVGFSTVGDDNLVSPLAPTNGSRHISVGAKYDVNERFAVSGGVRYTELGDAISSPGGNPVADFNGNSAVSVGISLDFKL